MVTISGRQFTSRNVNLIYILLYIIENELIYLFILFLLIERIIRARAIFNGKLISEK